MPVDTTHKPLLKPKKGDMKEIVSKAKELLQKQGQARYLSNGCPVDTPLSKPKKGEHRRKKAAKNKAKYASFAAHKR